MTVTQVEWLLEPAAQFLDNEELMQKVYLLFPTYAAAFQVQQRRIPENWLE